MRITRQFLSILVSLLLVVLSAGSAIAAPTGSKNAATFDLLCDNGQTYTIVTNGNGSYTPGHILNSTSKEIIPVSIEITGFINGEEFFHDVSSKPGRMAGLQDALITCTFSFSETDPTTGDTFTIEGSALVFFTPRR